VKVSRIAFFQATWGAGDCGAGILPASSMLSSKIPPHENYRKKRPRYTCGLLAQAGDKVAIIEKQCERAATTRALKTADDLSP
jgi:hypothetical protein